MSGKTSDIRKHASRTSETATACKGRIASLQTVTDASSSPTSMQRKTMRWSIVGVPASHVARQLAGSFWHAGTHFCWARQSALAVHAVETASWQLPPVPTDFWRHAEHFALRAVAVAEHSACVQSVEHGGAPASAPVPVHAQPNSVSTNVL